MPIGSVGVLKLITEGREIGTFFVKNRFFRSAAWLPLCNWWQMCFLDVKCAGENFGISFMKIGCVCGKLQGKRSSDRNRSPWFFADFLFLFAL